MKHKSVLLIIAISAFIALSAYYYVAFQLPSQEQAMHMRMTIEAMRRGE